MFTACSDKGVIHAKIVAVTAGLTADLPPQFDAGIGKPVRFAEIQAVIAPFRADIVDVAQKTIVVQVVGTHDKVDAFIDVLRPYGIKQLARTGVTGLKRG